MAAPFEWLKTDADWALYGEAIALDIPDDLKPHRAGVQAFVTRKGQGVVYLIYRRRRYEG